MKITHAGAIPVEVRPVPRPGEAAPDAMVLLQLPPGTSWVVMTPESARNLARALTITAEEAEA